MVREIPLTLTNRKATLLCGPGSVSDELWKVISGFPDYMVSTYGRVKRVKDSRSRNPTYRSGRLLKHIKLAGYPSVCLWVDGARSGKMVHILVAEAFLGPCPIGKEVDHKDANKENPVVGNLEYVTHKENMRRARALGRIPLGEENGKSRLTESQVKMILLSDSRVPDYRHLLAQELKVSCATVTDVCLGRTWKWVRL
jgi:hypothetical protein